MAGIKVRAIVPFNDLLEGTYRMVGDEFAVTKERFEQINRTGEEQLGRPYVEKLVAKQANGKEATEESE